CRADGARGADQLPHGGRHHRRADGKPHNACGERPMMKTVIRILGYAVIALFCAGAVAAAAYYVFDPKFANNTRSVASKGGHGHGEKEGADHHDEGVKLNDAQVAAAGIELLTAGPRELRDILRLNGMIQPNQEALAKVTPRFPGVIRSMR